MLTPDQVRPFLWHDDELLRERALVYFAEAADSSLLQADDLWMVVDRFGPRNSIFRALSNASHTTTSTARLIESLVKGRGSPEQDVLERSLLSLPLEHLETVTTHPVAGLLLSKSVRRGSEGRRLLATKTVDALWDELIAFADEIRNRESRSRELRGWFDHR